MICYAFVYQIISLLGSLAQTVSMCAALRTASTAQFDGLALAAEATVGNVALMKHTLLTYWNRSLLAVTAFASFYLLDAPA